MVTIGRSPHSDLFLDDVTVSRHHARVLRDEAGFWVEDLNSLNGTYVNRKRIEQQRLFDRDELQIGKFKLAFVESADRRARRMKDDDALLTIGQVVDQLKSDFPDLSITKVRYLEDRGLLTPRRTAGRYRKYSGADIRRLRAILTLQRDQYLPLEVIRERVDGRRRDVRASHLASARPGASPSLKREDAVYTQTEICENAGIDSAFLRLLVEYRLIDRRGQQGAVFTESDLEIARICQLLVRFGVEPRNLRLLGSSVEREAALVEQIATPSLRSAHADKREYGEKMVEDLGSLLSQLMQLLLYKELHRLL